MGDGVLDDSKHFFLTSKEFERMTRVVNDSGQPISNQERLNLMRRFQHEGENQPGEYTDLEFCSKFESAAELLAKRWTWLIIRALLTGNCRFTDLTEVIPGMSDRILAQRLKELSDMGILSKRVYQKWPVRVEYVLTEKGRALKETMDQIQVWADRWI